jgi:hypothetical protein
MPKLRPEPEPDPLFNRAYALARAGHFTPMTVMYNLDVGRKRAVNLISLVKARLAEEASEPVKRAAKPDWDDADLEAVDEVDKEMRRFAEKVAREALQLVLRYVAAALNSK